MYHDDIGRPHDACDWRDVADKVETKLVVQGRVARVEGTGHEQRVAVCGRAHDRLGSYICTSTRPVLNDECLVEAFREPLTYQTGENVCSAAARITDDDAHRPRRIALRPRYPRRCRQRGNAGGQIQEFPTVRKLHGVPSRTLCPYCGLHVHFFSMSIDLGSVNGFRTLCPLYGHFQTDGPY